ncbi:hypothetical protein Taro_019010 [Colocasia esculenta]|uniref:Uncharacterized protein n=1 Tax=Colocasia esculenta TaxID=4460 RepID=A0A843USU1_COLES|nr:hypothetical protein [Colocasia esculenta]
MAEVIIERMKYASAIIWDMKNKINISLPYAHLLTKIFQHYNLDLNGEVSEKMGQAIRSRNLKKSGFSLVAGVWTKTSVAEGEAIIGEGPEVPPVQAAEAEAEVQLRVEAQASEDPVVPAIREQPEEVRTEIPVVQEEEEEAAAKIRIEVPVASARRIEEIPPEHIEPVGQSSEVESPSTVVAVVIEDILGTITNIHGEQEEVMAKVMAPDHSADVPMEDAPVQWEHTLEKEAEIQWEHTASAPVDMFQEGVVESPSYEDVDNVEPTFRARGKGKGVAQVALLTRRAHHSSKKKKLRVNMKAVINRLDAHREILCSLKNEVSSIFMSQSTGAKQIGAMKAELQSLKGPSIAEEEVRTSGPVGAEDAGPSGPKVVEGQPAQAASGLSGPSVEQPGPLGPVVDEQLEPSGPVESQDEQGRVEVPVEEVVPLEPPSSPFQTPAPPSPPSSTTAPPALATFKQPLPMHISSPTPFPTTTSSSSASSTFIPPPSEAPPASSSSAGASSSSPSSSRPSIPPPSTAYSFLHPPTPPSFVTIIPEGAQLEGPFIQDIKDEFEVAILHTVLVMGRILVQKGNSLAFHKFVYREYHQGHIKSDVLAPLLSECERLSPSDWERLYPLTAQQLLDLNASQARLNQPPLSAAQFLDLNSIHLF